VREHVCDATAAHDGHGLSAATCADTSAANWAFSAHWPPDPPRHKAGSEKYTMGRST
jgi:hypothetical protein